MKKLISTKNNYSEAVARRYSVRKGVLRNFANFTGKHLCESFLFNKFSFLFNHIFIQIMGRSKIYVNESVNRQSGLVVYLPTIIIFSLNHELKHIIFPGTPRNLKKTFSISKKCNKGDMTG